MTALLRPQLAKMVLSYVKEAAYATAVADASVIKRFDMLSPGLATHEIERIDDADIIKGHEFMRDTEFNTVVNQGGNKPFEFVASAEILGLLMSMGLGKIVTGGAGPYSHTLTALDAAVTDQLPSISMVEAITGDTTTYQKYVGVVVNEFKIACENRGRIIVSGNFITNGSLTAKPAFSIPSTVETTNPMSGKDVLFKTVDAGGSLVDITSLLRSVSFGWNNNVDLGDARGQIGTGTPYITTARFGAARQPSLSVKLWGNVGDQQWIDYLAGTMKYVQLTFQGPNATSVVIDFNRCKIKECKPGFDGIRNTLEIEYMLFSTSTSTLTPLSAVITNGVSGYLT
jgi:hypothetical protein